MNIAITGSSGFIGSHIKEMIQDMGINILTISHKSNSTHAKNNFNYDYFFSGKIDVDIDCIIHLASPNYDYAKDDSLKNGITTLTKKILCAMPQYNCKKIIFFSSAKVYGEPSFKQNIFYENSKLNPISDYGKEKVNAENAILSFSSQNNIDFIIYRMPMVYGPGMSSNIGKLFKLINKKYPLISFSNTNHLKKSFLSIDNIKILIRYNIQNPATINKAIFNIADGENLSLNEFIKLYIKTSKLKIILISLPKIFFVILCKMPFSKKLLTKLYGSFTLDIKKINEAYNIELKNTEECLSNILIKQL